VSADPCARWRAHLAPTDAVGSVKDARTSGVAEHG